MNNNMNDALKILDQSMLAASCWIRDSDLVTSRTMLLVTHEMQGSNQWEYGSISQMQAVDASTTLHADDPCSATRPRCH